MKYYRLIFKKDEKGVAFSEIVEQVVDEKTFESMIWDKPIIKHFDGKYLHFISLNSEYLECMILGISAYKELEEIKQ